MERRETALATERASFDRQREAALAELEAARAEQARKAARDKRVLEKQQRTLLRLPSKAQRSEVRQRGPARATVFVPPSAAQVSCSSASRMRPNASKNLDPACFPTSLVSFILYIPYLLTR
eukprot:1102100-Prorocentrum_minimum.AAC.1